MKSVKLVLLLALSFVSLSQNIFSDNNRNIASVDCINCDGILEANPSEIKQSESVKDIVKVVEKVAPKKEESKKETKKKLSNKELFKKLKSDNKCGEYFAEGRKKITSRLKEDKKYFISIDPMYSEIEDLEMAMFMRQPEEGHKSSSKNSKPYVGASVEGDLMMMEKVYKGNDLVGYNFNLSFCKEKYNKSKVIHDDRAINEMFFAGISLTEDEICDGHFNIELGTAAFQTKSDGFFSKKKNSMREFNSLNCE
jgi:hypothetical protein